jgi:hypothetical protein
MSEPEKTRDAAPPDAGETQEIESLLVRLDQPSDVSRALLFCASLASLGFVAAQNFNAMSLCQTILNATAAASFALSLAVVFFQWDFRGRNTANVAPATGLRAYIAPLKSMPGVRFLRRQRFDRISFALVMLGVVLVFAAKMARFTTETHV